MSLRSRLIKNFLSVGVINAFALLVGFLVSVLLARSLGVEVFGQYSFIMSLVPLLALPIAAGLPQLLTREIAGYIELKQWGLFQGGIKSAYSWVGLSSAVLVLVCFVFFLSGLIPLAGYGFVIPLALLLVGLNGLNAVRQGIMRGLGSPSMAVLPEMLVQPLLLLVSLFVLNTLFDLNLLAALSAHVVSALFAMISAVVILRRLLPEEVHGPEPEFRKKQWLKALLPFGLLQIFAVLNLNIGTVLVGFLSTDAEVAAMRVAEKFSQLIVLPVIISNFVIAPHIVVAWKKRDMERMQLLARHSARATFLLCLPFSMAFILWGEPLLSLVYGEAFAIAAQPLSIIAFGQIVKGFCGPVGILLTMTNHEGETLKCHIVALLVSVSLCLLLIPHYGASGAAVGISVGLVVWNAMLGISVYRNLRIKPSAI